MNYQKLTNEQALDLSLRADTLASDMAFEASRLRDLDFDESLWDYTEAEKALTLMEKHFESFRKKRLQMDEAFEWPEEED